MQEYSSVSIWDLDQLRLIVIFGKEKGTDIAQSKYTFLKSTDNLNSNEYEIKQQIGGKQNKESSK